MAKSTLDLVKQLKASGADCSKLPGENLYLIDAVFGDPSWTIFERWALDSKKDPIVSASYSPSPVVIGTILCPANHLVWPILQESNSIILYYSQLMADAFEHDRFPLIGNPIEGPPARTTIKHPQLALSALLGRIQSPPANYPTIASLHAGSYICTVTQIWANAVISVTLFKE